MEVSLKWSWNRSSRYSSAQSSYNTAKKRYEESQQFLRNLNDEGINKDALNDRFYKSISGQLQAQIQSEETTLLKIADQIGDCKIVAECDVLLKTYLAKSDQ